MKNIYTYFYKSTIGIIRMAATDKGLAYLTLPGISNRIFKENLIKIFPDSHLIDDARKFIKISKQLNAYFEGKLKKFDIKLDLQATSFEKIALKAVLKIPYGKVRTYGEIAKQISHPKSARAVGNANARNKIPIIIPCHRVVAVNGLGGYAGGLKLKKKLLNLENIKRGKNGYKS